MKINTLYIDENNGLFNKIQANIQSDWFNDDLAFLLNMEYFLGRSGEKTMSPLCYKIVQNMFLVDDDGNFMYDDNGNNIVGDDYSYALDTLAKLIVANFKYKWDETYQLLTKKIDVELSNSTKGNSKVSTKAEEINNHTYDNQNKIVSSVYGFDSTSPSPASDSSGESSSKNAENNTFIKDENNNYTSNTHTEEYIDNERITDRITKLINLRRNLMSEIIMKDVDSMIALMVYID